MLQTQYTYEPFGYPSQTGAASTNSYKFTGREEDGTGLLYYRARYYHPRLQRFIAEDPIGFAGGDVNLYRYANGDPISNIDPTGEFVPLIVILPSIGGIAGGVVDVLNAGECESKLTAFGRGFLSGAAGTLSGVGVVASTGNPFLAGAAAGAVSQGLDQVIAGRADLEAAAVAVAAGSLSGGGFKFQVQRVNHGAAAHRLPGASQSRDIFLGAY